MEDRFLTLEFVQKVSLQLEAIGFRHIVGCYHIDPEWRAKYRPNRPELEPIAWSISISESLIPMDKIEKLIEICEANNLVVWWSMSGGGEEGPYLFLKVGTSERVQTCYVTPDR